MAPSEGTTDDAPPEERGRFAEVRRANRSETAEDYVEAIADLVAARGEARVKDLVETFGVSHVTVSRTVDRLMRDGLCVTEPYRSIELTPAGDAMAARSQARHLSVLRFLLALGVAPEVARLDAEGVEHHVSDVTVKAFDHFADARGVAAEIEEAPPDPERFRRVRESHAMETAEDYVEAIADLIGATGEARVVELARIFGVSHVTVSRTVGRLQTNGLVTTEPYRPIELTELGQRLAAESKRRHQIVLDFLLSLGIPSETAHLDAEGMEHHVSAATLACLAALTPGHP
ncbi:MAG: manganese-binding transcriptional regulator MntR [Planctomycetota bacterium]